MDLKHYVITTRPVDLVPGTGTLPDQYWYESDENDASENAVPYFRCGHYIDTNGTVDAPTFYDPQGEDIDYQISSGQITASQQQAKGGSLKMLSDLFDELDAQNKDLLVFMFGYENGMVKEYDHITHIHTNYIEAGNTNISRLLMITWPSQSFGEYDEKLGNPGLLKRLVTGIFGNKNQPKTEEQVSSDVGITGNALSVFLLKLKTFTDARYALSPNKKPKIHFIVQSMANHILNQTFINLTALNAQTQVTNLMDTLMLTSPDIRNDIFQQSPAYFQSTAMARQAYVFFSHQDRILSIADVVHPIAGASRLGHVGPNAGEVLPANMNAVQVIQSVFKLIPPDFSHRYFEYNQAVIDRYASIFKGTVDTTIVKA